MQLMVKMHFDKKLTGRKMNLRYNMFDDKI